MLNYIASCLREGHFGDEREGVVGEQRVVMAHQLLPRDQCSL